MNLGSLVVAAVLFRDLIMQSFPSKFTLPPVEQTGAGPCVRGDGRL